MRSNGKPVPAIIRYASPGTIRSTDFRVLSKQRELPNLLEATLLNWSWKIYIVVVYRKCDVSNATINILSAGSLKDAASQIGRRGVLV